MVISAAKPSGTVSVISEPKILFEDSGTTQYTIMSANLWHDWPRNRRLKERLVRLVSLVNEEKVDILLLQELSRTNHFEADKWLSEQLGMAYVYSRSNGNAKDLGFEEGLAIFSRYPIKDHRLAELSDQNHPFSRRMALGTKIETQSGDFLVFTVHLGLLKKQNQKQLTRLQAWVEEEAGDNPAVIGGDFNAHEESKQIQTAKSAWYDSFRAVNPHGEAYSHEIRWPWGNVLRRSRLDYLFLRRGRSTWTVDEARHLDDHPYSLSDHSPVLIKTSFAQVGGD